MIPKYNEAYGELLRLMADRQERKRADIRAKLAAVYHLTDEERARMTDSGKQTVFASNPDEE